MPDLPIGTVTFLFTDIEGSTLLLQQLADRYREVVDRHAEIFRDAIVRGGGSEVGTEGDAFFAVFPLPSGRSRPPPMLNAASPLKLGRKENRSECGWASTPARAARRRRLRRPRRPSCGAHRCGRPRRPGPALRRDTGARRPRSAGRASRCAISASIGSRICRPRSGSGSSSIAGLRAGVPRAPLARRAAQQSAACRPTR